MPRKPPEMGSEGDVFFERVIAVVIDSIIVALVAGFLGGVLTAGLSSTGIRAFAAIGATINSVVSFGITLGYFVYFEVDSGQTIGKRAMGIVVVTDEGEDVDYAAGFIRNLLRPVDFLPGFYLLGALVMVITERSQRIGDYGADTVVTRTRSAGE